MQTDTSQPPVCKAIVSAVNSVNTIWCAHAVLVIFEGFYLVIVLLVIFVLFSFSRTCFQMPF